MTRDADLKRLVRARMASTGENYTTARAALLRPKEVPMLTVTVDVRVYNRSEQEIETMRARLQEKSGPGSTEGMDLSKQDVIVLSEDSGPRKLAIWCANAEATSIRWALDGVETERPMTHDLLRDVVTAMGEPRAVRVTGLRDKTYYAELVVVDRAGVEQTISCRPSDGIAFGLRASIPILVADELMSTYED
ncbi:MAG: bifunctional nuclease family protein [Actinomycetota bacterium]